MEEVRGKPGWTGNCYNESIYFRIEFGYFPSLAIAFLKSYAVDMGAVEVSISSSSSSQKASSLGTAVKAVDSFRSLGVIDGKAYATSHPDWKHSLAADFVFLPSARHIDPNTANGQEQKSKEVEDPWWWWSGPATADVASVPAAWFRANSTYILKVTLKPPLSKSESKERFQLISVMSC